MTELPEATRRLVSRVPGHEFRVQEFPQGTKTAQANEVVDASGKVVAVSYIGHKK